MDIITVLIILAAAWACYVLIKNVRTDRLFDTLPSSNIPATALDRFYDEIRGKFARGEMAERFGCSIILKKNEFLIFEIPNIELCEERTIKRTGSYQGFSVRIMKGVSYRFGGFQSAPQKGITELDVGTLTVTNKRLVFAGSTKSVAYPLSKINSIDAAENGICVSRTGKAKVEYFLETSNTSLTEMVTPDEGEAFEPEAITYRFSGYECEAILTTLVQQSE